MKQHARYSPSKLESLESCIRFEYKESESDAATEGTELHAAYEAGDSQGRGLTQEQQRVVDQALLYAQGIRIESPVTYEAKEIKLTVKDLTYGYCDHLIIQGERGHVLDAKFGRKGATEAKDNFQIQCYVCAMFEEYPSLVQVTGHIVDPRASEVPSSHVFYRDSVPIIRKRISDLYERIANPFNPPTPEPALCAKCKWASGCSALNQTVALMARGIGLPVPSQFAPEAMVSPMDRAIAQHLGPVFKNWWEQVSEGNTDYVVKGGEIPGFRLISRSTGFKVDRKDTLEAFNSLEASNLITKEELISASTLSINGLSELLEELKGGSKAEWKQMIVASLGTLASEGLCKYLQKVKEKK